MKRAFSLFEIILFILIVSIISTIAYQKFFNVLEKVNLSQIKAEIVLINNSINQLKSSQLMLDNSGFIVEKLDEAPSDMENFTLFNGYDEYVLLDTPIISTSETEKKIGFWIKVSNSKYKVYLSKDDFVEFNFDGEKFFCNEEIDFCKEIMYE